MSRIIRILTIAGILSLSVSYVALWLRFISDPVERTGSDFIAFFSSGNVARQHGYSQVYVPDRIRAVQAKEVGFELGEQQVLLYNHPPYLVPILRLLFNKDYVASFYRWILLMIVFYVAALIVLHRISIETGKEQPSWLTGLGAFLFLPVYFSLMNGQDTALLLLGAALWIYGLMTGRDVLAGIGLSFTTIRPHISLLLALPMVFQHRKAFITYVIGGGLLAIVSFLIMGVEGLQNYINILLISAGGEWHGMKEEAMFNLIGLLKRAAPGLSAEAIRISGWTFYGLTLLGLFFLWSGFDNRLNNKIGLTVILALVMVPHLHFHDLALLLIPMYELIYSGKLKAPAATVLPIAASLLLLISNSSFYLQYSIPYLIILGLAVYPYFQRPGLTTPHRSQLPEK
jgi:hypothetical protein